MRQEKYLRGVSINHVKWQIWTIELWHKWHWKIGVSKIIKDKKEPFFFPYII